MCLNKKILEGQGPTLTSFGSYSEGPGVIVKPGLQQSSIPLSTNHQRDEMHHIAIPKLLDDFIPRRPPIQDERPKIVQPSVLPQEKKITLPPKEMELNTVEIGTQKVGVGNVIEPMVKFQEETIAKMSEKMKDVGTSVTTRYVPETFNSLSLYEEYRLSCQQPTTYDYDECLRVNAPLFDPNEERPPPAPEPPMPFDIPVRDNNSVFSFFDESMKWTPFKEKRENIPIVRKAAPGELNRKIETRDFEAKIKEEMKIQDIQECAIPAMEVSKNIADFAFSGLIQRGRTIHSFLSYKEAMKSLSTTLTKLETTKTKTLLKEFQNIEKFLGTETSEFKLLKTIAKDIEAIRKEKLQADGVILPSWKFFHTTRSVKSKKEKKEEKKKRKKKLAQMQEDVKELKISLVEKFDLSVEEKRHFFKKSVLVKKWGISVERTFSK